MVRGVLLLLLFISTSASAQEIPRKRISYRGSIVPQIHGPAKWSVNNSVTMETTPGDLFLVETNVAPKEKQAVAVYAWAVPLKEEGDQWVLDGEPFRVKASRMGKNWGYESQTFKSAGTFSMLSNASADQIQRQVQLFLPYAALDLPPGKNYEIRYEVAITVGTNFLDQFFINRTFRRFTIPGTGEKIKVSTQQKVLEFTLDGAEDDTPKT